MVRYNWKLIGVCVFLWLCMAVSCQKDTKVETEESIKDDFVNVCTIPDSFATAEQLAEKERLIGFLYNENVMQFRNGRIEIIADSDLFYKNNVDIRYMAYFREQVEETNRGIDRMLKEGTIPKDSFPKIIETAVWEGQQIHSRPIIK